MSTEIDFEDRLRRSRGRPSRSRVVSAKATRDEHDELEKAAKAEGKALSEWAREVLLREARRPKHDLVLTEIIATRMMLINIMKPLLFKREVTEEWLTKLIAATRDQKRQAAEEVMRQYAPETQK